MLYQQEPGFAIVGCGLIGRRRASSLPAGSLKQVFDVEEIARWKWLGFTQTVLPQITLEEVLHDESVRAVIVSTTNNALAPTALAAVRAAKHVLVEKPGAIASKDLAEIESAAAVTGSLVRIGYNHRFHPAF